MNHFEEHILELYVLGSRKVEAKRDQIAAHLDECAGCRVLVDEMGRFYQGADDEFKVLQQSKALDQKALVRSHRSLASFGERARSAMPYVSTAPMGKLLYFVYRHPYVSGGGAVAFGAAVMALSLLLSSPIKDMNPAKFKHNFKEGSVEIYNKEDEKLWQILSPDLISPADSSDVAAWRNTVIQDLDNDGTNEVLTSLDIVGEVEPNHSLCIYDSRKHVKRKVGFHVPFQYLNRVYSPDFEVGAIFAGDLYKTGAKEILVIATNHRSPSFLARLDSHGNELGKYWHFGWFNGLDTVEVNNNDKPEIVLWGLNDVADSLHREFGAIVVLDPSKVIGDKKSSATPGFRFDESDAEMYYIRLPRSDMDEALGINSGLCGMVRSSDNTLVFHARGEHSQAADLSFDYVFSTDMSILQVKSYNSTDRLHSELAEQGKVNGEIDKKYLEDLKNAVRYWDGAQWVKEPVKVRHQDQLAIVN